MKPFNLLLTLIYLVLLPMAAKSTTILPNSNLLVFDGIYTIKRSSELTTFERFSEEVLNDSNSNFSTHRAQSTGGIILRFKTRSKNIKVNFVLLKGGLDGDGADWTKWFGFGIFQNGTFDKMWNYRNIEITSKYPGEVVEYEITLPSILNVGLKNIILDENESLLPIEKVDKPQYIAIGNSITHGIGQLNEAYMTYPYKLAKKAGWELHNLAVGGASVSPSVTKMFANQKADIVTILFGFNDWRNNDIELFKNRYNTLLANIRKNHPGTMIYCISTITSTDTTIRKYSLDDYRNAVVNIVDSLKFAGDDNIFVIHGDKITTVDDLSDGVHLNRDGADHFADSLYKLIDVNAINANVANIRKSNSYHLIKNRNDHKISFSGSSKGITLFTGRYIDYAEIEIFNVDGSKIDQLNLQNIEQGNTILRFKKINNLPSGIYFLNLNTGSDIFKGKLMIR